MQIHSKTTWIRLFSNLWSFILIYPTHNLSLGGLSSSFYSQQYSAFSSALSSTSSIPSPSVPVPPSRNLWTPSQVRFRRHQPSHSWKRLSSLLLRLLLPYSRRLDLSNLFSNSSSLLLCGLSFRVDSQSRKHHLPINPLWYLWSLHVDTLDPLDRKLICF